MPHNGVTTNEHTEALHSSFFTALIMLSVCLSVTRVNCDKMNESSADILIPYERKILVVFRTQRMVGGGNTLLPETFDQTNPPSFKIGDFHSIFARSVGSSEKSSIMTIIGAQ